MMLFRLHQPALGLDRQLKLLRLRRRRRADAAERGLDVLVLNGRHDVGRGELERGEAVGVEPEPQRIVEGAEQRGLTHATHARQRVEHVDRGVIVEIERVVGVSG
jgi:hypothetical protein